MFPKLTIDIGTMLDFDPSIFDGLALPSIVNRNALLDMLVMECSELCLVVTRPDILKREISAWALSRRDSWERMAHALSEEYNPLHNYDKLEDWTDSGESVSKVAGFNAGSLVENGGGTGTSTHTGHTRGNVGTTKTQEMIQDELELRKQDLYQIIVDDFKGRFCILIY